MKITQLNENIYTYVNPSIRHARKLELAGIESFICTTENELVKKIISGIPGVKVHLHLRFISRLPLGSRMGCAPVSTILIVIGNKPLRFTLVVFSLKIYTLFQIECTVRWFHSGETFTDCWVWDITRICETHGLLSSGDDKNV